jgi:D-alanyl-D-alanine carboxypeptidase (penicillin-binding protein 5/6)
VTVTTQGSVVGSAAVTWGGVVHRVPVATSATARLPAWPGRSVSVVHTLAVAPGTRQGTTVGAVHYALGSQQVTVALRVDRTVPEPSWWWRLTHHL